MTVLQFLPAAAKTGVFLRKLKRRHPFTCEPRLIGTKIVLYTAGKVHELVDGVVKKVTMSAAQIA